jgi:hypothetical protein
MHRTPVISTGWSGTVDFCDPENTWGVAAPLVPVVDTHPEFAGLKGAVWADPSPEEAAAHLRAIYLAPEAAVAKAERARAYLTGYLADNSYEKALLALSDLRRS